jgi:prephenate dehydratase
MRVAYLGPAGTFTEDGLRAALAGEPVEELPTASVYEAITAVQEGAAERAFVPFENSIEGAVTTTLDTLALDATDVAIVGEHDLAISHCLIAREEMPLDRIEVVLSHPQANAQCARFVRERLPAAEVRAASSTADAVRIVSESDRPWAALGASAAARLYGAAILLDGVEDDPSNVTRFVWIAPAGTEPSGEGAWRSSLVFSELGADHPGALVEALQEFAAREVNLTRIESRPLRGKGLGRYMFFIDIEGSVTDSAVSEAIEGLRTKAESVRVLGSYPMNPPPGVPGAG